MSALSLELSHDGKRIYVLDADGTVATVDNDDVPQGQAEKYARLFCAAPEMLAVLKELVASRNRRAGVRDLDGTDGRYARARAVIAKAVKP